MAFDPDSFLAKPAMPQPMPPMPSAQPPVEQLRVDQFDPDAFLNQEGLKEKEALQAQYGGLGQGIVAGLEHYAKGVAGPFATLAEKKMAQAGIAGLTPEEQAKREEAHPIVSIVGELGGLMTPFGQGPLLGMAGKGAAAAVGLGKATGLLGKIGAGAVKGAVENGLFQFGDETSKLINGQSPEVTAQTILPNVGFAALIGGAIGGPMGGVSHYWDKVVGSKVGQAVEGIKAEEAGQPDPAFWDQSLGRKILRRAFVTAGPFEEQAVTRYPGRYQMAKNIPEFEDVHAKTQDFVKGILDDADKKTIDLEQAQKAFDELKKSKTAEFQDLKTDHTEATRLAKQALDDAQATFTEQKQTAALNQSQPINEALAKLYENIWMGSSNAFDILSQGESISFKPIYKLMRDQAAKLRESASPTANKLADQLLNHLQIMRNTLAPVKEAENKIAGMGELSAKKTMQAQESTMVRPPQAKIIIQEIGRLGYPKGLQLGVSEFDQALTREYKALYEKINGILKENEPYRKAMVGVAADTELNNKLSHYGIVEDAERNIKGLSEPVKYRNEMPLLKELENRTGIKFTEPLEEYANPELRARREELITEYLHYEQMADIKRQVAEPRFKRSFEENLKRSPEFLDMLEKETAQEEALRKKANLEGITDKNLQDKFIAAAQGKRGKPNFELERILNKLPEYQAMPLVDILKDIRMLHGMKGGVLAGSRMVNVGIAAGNAIGAMFGSMVGGPIGTGIGMAAGALAGAHWDKFGREYTKKALDYYLEHAGLGKLMPEADHEALRLGLAKTLDSNQPFSARAFKATVNGIQATVRGENLMGSVARGIFRQAPKLLPEYLKPSIHDLKKIDEHVQKSQVDPSHLQRPADHLAHYMPDHATAVTQTVTQATQYLNSIRPTQTKKSPLDLTPPVNAMAEQSYKRAMAFAQQPLMLAEYLRQGTITAQDVAHVKAMYPEFYQRFTEHIVNQLSDHISKGKTVPYSMRAGLSLMLGQPVDSSMTPEAIQANQAAFQTHAAQQALSNQVNMGGMQKMKSAERLSLKPAQE